ncbi:hypothetical protein HpKG64_02330 [Helicobacter pylori]
MHSCMPQKYRGSSKFESCPHTFASTEYNSLLQILSFGVISQKSEFFVKNGLNKLFYVLKLYLYIKIYKYNLKLYLYVDFIKLLRCFCVGRKFRAFRVFGSKRVAIVIRL